MGNKTVAPAPPAPTADVNRSTDEKETNAGPISPISSSSVSIPSPTRRDTFVTPINPMTSQIMNQPADPAHSRVSSGLEIPMTVSEIMPPTSPDASTTIPISMTPVKSPTFISTTKIPSKPPSTTPVTRTNTNLSNKTGADPAPIAVTPTITSRSEPQTQTHSFSTKQWYRKTPVDEKPATPKPIMTPPVEEVKKVEISRQPSTITVKKPEVPPVRDIVAVPSYHLRSTAVILRPFDERRSLDRAHSIHSVNSSVTLPLSQRPSNQTVLSDHSKSTMFQMDARTKPIPFPTPAVLLLTKDFNDGRLITETPLAPPPSFASLGLDQDLETDSTDHSLMARVQEKQQLASQSMSLVTYGGPETDQPDEKFSPAPPRPLPSILKKPTFQQPRHSFSLNEPRRAAPETNNTSVVSFNLPSMGKAAQSISRSEKLFSRPVIRSVT